MLLSTSALYVSSRLLPPCSSPTSDQRPTCSSCPQPDQHAPLFGNTRSYPHPMFGQQIRPVGAAMISPIQSKRSTCSHRHAGRELSRSVWLSVSVQLDGPDVDAVRESTFICAHGANRAQVPCSCQPLLISSTAVISLSTCCAGLLPAYVPSSSPAPHSIHALSVHLQARESNKTSLTRIKNCRFSADWGLLRLVENEASDAQGLALPHDAGVLGDRGVIKGLTLSMPDPADTGTFDDSKKLKSPGWRAAFGGVPTVVFNLPRRNLSLPAPPPPPAPATSQPPPAPLPVLLTLLSAPPLWSASTPRDEASANIPSLSDGSTLLESSSLSNTNTVLFRCTSPHRPSPVHPAPRPLAAPALPRPAAQAFNLLGDGVFPNGD